MKIFEWISQAYLRANPRPPYLIQRHDASTAAAATITVSVVIPTDADFLGSIGLYGYGTGGQLPGELELTIQPPGASTDVSVYKSGRNGANDTLSFFVEEIYVPRGSVVFGVFLFTAGVANNNAQIMAFGYGIPPADVL